MSLSEDIFNKTEGNTKIIIDDKGTEKDVRTGEITPSQQETVQQSPSQNPMSLEDINKNYDEKVLPEIPNNLKPEETVNSFVVATKKEEAKEVPSKEPIAQGEKTERTNLVKQYNRENPENLKKKKGRENPDIKKRRNKENEDKEEIERITKEAQLSSHEGSDDKYEKKISALEERIAKLEEESFSLKKENSSLKEDFIKLWEEKLDSTPLDTTEEEDVPDWVEQISKEPEDLTPDVIPTPPHTPDSTEPEDTTPEVVIPMPPHTPDTTEPQEDENQQIINVDPKDIIDVEPQEQGIILAPGQEIIDVSFAEEENKDIDQERRERNYKRIALVAGFVTGATTGMVVGSAAIPPIGISVAVAAGATSLGRSLVGKGIKNIEGRLAQAQTPEEKASLERRLTSYNTIHRRLGYVKSFLTGGAFGLLAANFFSSTYFGGESILGNQTASTPEIAPDITTEVPSSQEVGTGSILESAPTPDVGQLPDISDGWLDTNQFGWDTSKFGWQGSRLYVPTEGVVPGGAPDLQAKFVDALFNQGISQNHLMGQEAGSLFNEGLINAAYRGQDVEQVAKATAEALKGLVR